MTLGLGFLLHAEFVIQFYLERHILTETTITQSTHVRLPHITMCLSGSHLYFNKSTRLDFLSYSPLEVSSLLLPFPKILSGLAIRAPNGINWDIMNTTVLLQAFSKRKVDTAIVHRTLCYRLKLDYVYDRLPVEYNSESMKVLKAVRIVLKSFI